ncbi:MAG: hypothetical protein NWR85_07425 [Limnohabitans sp.]|nr:hypothetical protein [Limnohabitans sp.]
MLAFFYAAYQVFALNIARAYGATNHPIPFGNTAIVFSAVALVSGAMFPFEGPHAQKKRLFVWVAGVAGAGASLLSGSRGGWLSLFIVGFTVAYLATRHWPAWRRHLCAAAVMASLVLAPMYLEFGLTVSVFGTNVFRSVFVMLSVSLLALMAVRFNALKEAP